MRVFATLVYSLPDFRRKERARDVQTRKRRGPAVLNVFACFARFTLGFFLPSSQNLDALSFFFLFPIFQSREGNQEKHTHKKIKRNKWGIAGRGYDGKIKPTSTTGVSRRGGKKAQLWSRGVFHLCRFPMACDPVLRLPTVLGKEARERDSGKKYKEGERESERRLSSTFAFSRAWSCSFFFLSPWFFSAPGAFISSRISLSFSRERRRRSTDVVVRCFFPPSLVLPPPSFYE